MSLQVRKPGGGSSPRRSRLPVAGGLLAFAVLVAGVGLPSGKAQAPDKKADPKKDDKDRRADPTDDEVNALLLDYSQNLRFLLNDLRRDNLENPYGIYRPRQPAMMAPAQANCFPTPVGASVERLAPTLADQFDLKKDLGLVVCKVADGTPGAKAGLKSHDILLEINGKQVPNDVGMFLKMLDDIKMDTPFDAVVLRKGKKETIKGLTVPGAKARSDARPVADPIAVVERVPPDDPHALARFVAAATVPPVAGRALCVGGKCPVQTMSVRTGDKFTTRFQEGSVLINVTGKVMDGKSAVGEILVHDAAGTVTYKEVQQVPEQYRGKVQSLVEVNEFNDIRIAPRKK